MQRFQTQDDVLLYFSALPYEALLAARHENHAQVPGQMGIYFWFLREDGFEKLSGKLPVIVRPPQQTIRIGDACLVYYGHVGTDTNPKQVAYSNNLKYYFQSAIPHKHLEYNLECYSYLSCLRKTISGLLCDDILAEQEVVKAFFNDYLLIYYLSYEATSQDEGVVASKAARADFGQIRRTLYSFHHPGVTVGDHKVLNDFIDDLIFDHYSPGIRFIMESRRYVAEEKTLANVCHLHKIDSKTCERMVEATRFFGNKISPPKLTP